LEAKGIKNKKRIGLGEEIIYKNPKVFIRQSAKEIISSFDITESSANNSLYVFSLRDNSENSLTILRYICGILNSELITFFAQQRNIIRYSNGKQPQIKISDLGQILIPSDETLKRNISLLVSYIYSDRNPKWNNDINDLIYNYYDVSSEEIVFIKESIKSY